MRMLMRCAALTPTWAPTAHVSPGGGPRAAAALHSAGRRVPLLRQPQQRVRVGAAAVRRAALPYITRSALRDEDVHRPPTPPPPPPLMLPPPQQKPRSALPYYAAFFATGLAANSFGPLLPAIAERVAFVPSQMGPLLGAAGVGGIAGAAAFSLFSARSMRVLMPASLLALGAALGAVPHAVTRGEMALALATAGALFQGVTIAAFSLVARDAGERKGFQMNMIQACWGAGSLVAPALHWLLEAHPAVGGEANTLASYRAVSMLLVAAAVPFLRPPAPPAPDQLPISSPRASPRSGISLPGDLRVILPTLALVACAVSYATFLFTYAMAGPPGAAPQLMLSAFWLALTAGRVGASVAAARAPPHAVLRVALPLAVFGPCLLLLLPESRIALTAAVLAAGAGLGPAFAGAVGLMSRYVPVSPQTQGAVQLAGTLGGMAAAPAVAELARSGLGICGALPLVAGACAAAAWLAAGAARRGGETLTLQREGRRG